MDENKDAENKEEATATPTEPSQADPIKQELEKVQKTGRTEAEKAAFSLKKNAERAKELGVDPAEILGFKAESGELDKDAPLTVGMYEQMQKDRAQKTALQLADDIGDENERELTKHYLTNRIVSSGDPQADLQLAKGMVNSVRNSQILEETARATAAKAHASGAGAPPKREQNGGELTPAELPFTKAPYNMSKEQVIAARPKS